MKRPSRRHLLATVSAGLGASLAGCNVPRPEGVGDGGLSSSCTGELGGEVTGDRTLDCGFYRVTEDVRVESGGTLSITPGTTLSFAAGTGLSVAPGGSLVARGGDEDQVTFTAADGSGTWRGIEYEPRDGSGGDLRIQVAVLEGADGDGPALRVGATDEAATVSVQNVVVGDNGGTGVVLEEGVTIEAFAGNRITGNGGPPLECAAGTVGDVAASNDLSGNGTDAVRVGPTTLRGEHVWSPVGVPYAVRGTLPVEGRLTVEAGTTVALDRDETIHVRESGALTASGTGDDPVVFTGQRDRQGYWGGIWFENTAREENRLSNAVVEDAGGRVAPFATEPAGVAVGTAREGATASIAVENAVLRNAAGSGFWFGPGTEVGTFSDTEVRANGDLSGYCSPAAAGAIDPSCTFADNRREGVGVVEAPVPAETTVRWSPVGVPYRVRGTPTVRGTLRIAPGTTVEFDGGGLGAVDGGTLVAGGGDERTRLAGVADDPGAWNGVSAMDGASLRIENAVVEGAGGGAAPFADDPVAVAAGTTGEAADQPTLSLSDATIRDSGGRGLFLGEAVALESMDGVGLVDNEGLPLSIPASALPGLDDGTTFRDNGVSAVEVRGASGDLVPPGESFALQPIDVAYRFSGATTVRGDLTVRAGTTVSFAANADLRVLDGGNLTVAGDPEDRVTFRGVEETAGHWRGILVRDSTATLEHAAVFHAGGGRALPDAAFSAAVAVTTSGYRERATLELRDVLVHQSDGYAFYIGHFTRVDPENVEVGQARGNHNAESFDHEPHVPNSRQDHEEDD